MFGEQEALALSPVAEGDMASSPSLPVAPGKAAQGPMTPLPPPARLAPKATVQVETKLPVRVETKLPGIKR